MQKRITEHFSDSIDAKIRAAQKLPPIIEQGAEMLVNCLLNEGKILACGNGGAGANAQYLVSVLLNRFERERPSLPAISLCADQMSMSAIANDSNFNEVFSRQIRALGQQEDTLLVISTNGNCTNIVHAIQAAHDRNLQVIALTGKTGGDAARLLHQEDLEIRVQENSTQRVQEVHTLITHCLCNLIDDMLFSGE